jgi:hypothetical protein
MTCKHTDRLCFYENTTVSPVQYKAYCQRCSKESDWWPSMKIAERAIHMEPLEGTYVFRKDSDPEIFT